MNIYRKIENQRKDNKDLEIHSMKIGTPLYNAPE